MLTEGATRTAVIVGYGRAGRDLHHLVLESLYGQDIEVIIVDPVRPAVGTGGRWVRTLAAAFAELDGEGATERAVFHVTTPPADHLACLEEIAGRGGSRVIVEKPLVRTRAEAQRLAELVRSLTIVPVGVWLSSRVTELVSAQLGHGGVGQMRTLRIEQSKPRFARSAASRGHASALEVELPHQLLLALHLAGTEVQILEARTWDLLGPGGSIPALGGAHVVLEHQGGTLTTLATDLGAPVRMRRLTLTGTRGRVTADFPLGTGEDFGQVRLPSGQRVVVHDAPLTRLLHEAYAYFEGRGAAPPGSVGLHVRTIELLADIASIAEASAPAEPRETLFDYTVAA